MKLIRCLLLASLLMLCCTPPAVCGEGAELRLTTFSMEKQDDTLRVFSHIQVENLGIVRNQLRDGAQMVLKGVVTLHRLRTVLTNQLVASGDIVLHLRHDPLRRHFLVFRGKNVYQNRTLAQALEDAWTAAPISLPLVEPLVSGETYRLTLNLTLQHAEVPPWLEKALFFWSWDVVPPIQATQDFEF